MWANAALWLQANLEKLGASFELTTSLTSSHSSGREFEAGACSSLVVETPSASSTWPHAAVCSSRFDTSSPLAATTTAAAPGAVLACTDIAIAEGHDPNEPGLQDLTALDLLSGVAVLPHFTEHQLDSATRWVDAHQTTVLSLPEAAGRVYDRDGYLIVCRDSLSVINNGGRRLHRPGQTLWL